MITIIVLLILAGVSISLVVGNNGVLTQASNAVVTNREAEAQEEVTMAVAGCESDYWSDWATDKLPGYPGGGESNMYYPHAGNDNILDSCTGYWLARLFC